MAPLNRLDTVVVRNAATDPLVDAARLAALQVASMIAVPLIRAGKWRFWLGAYRPDAYDWRADEVELMRELTARIWTRLERARAEEALRESEEQLRLFLTASSDILYKLSADWRHMLYLEGGKFLAGTTASCATWLKTYIPAADQAAVGVAIEAAIAEHRLFELKHRILRADGSLNCVFSRAVPVFDAAGELVSWFGTATDVTARKQAEAALLESG